MSRDEDETTRAASEAVGAEAERYQTIRENLRIPKVSAPEEQLTFPANVGALNQDQLSEQLTYWSAMAAYAQTRLALVQSAALRATMDFEMEFDIRYTACTEQTVTDKRHYVGSVKPIRALRRKAARLESDALMIRALYEAYTMHYNAISREISRRREEYGRRG